MSRRFLYLILAVVGFVVPYYFFVSFLTAHGFDARLFVRQLFASPISTFFAADLLISCVVFAIFMGRESARLSMKRDWLYLVALCLVGLSFALPLFLYARESRLKSQAATGAQDHAWLLRRATKFIASQTLFSVSGCFFRAATAARRGGA